MEISLNKYIAMLGLILSSSFVNAQDSITVYPISINTDGNEFAPVYFNKGIVFSGTNRKNEGLTYVDNESNEQLTDLYYAPINDGLFNEVNIFSKELKTPFHDGPITFSADGSEAYFTRNIEVKKVLKNVVNIQNRLGVFKATFDGQKWANITPCFFNSPEYNVGQPCLSPDGSRIYVVSDKPDGYGGIDIYYAEIVDGFCGSLVNLGEVVNSSNNELFPFVDANHNLYFASDKEGGYGGLDIYQTKLFNGNWNDTYLMDTTINSSFDDFGLVYNEDETEGYFCSNRAGSDDIYKLTINYPAFTDCEELVNELLCYEFYEEATLNADSVAMIYEWDFGDGQKERSLETFHCYEKSGSYSVELNIMDPIVGKTFVNEATYELQIEEVIQPEVIVPDTLSINLPFKVSVLQGKWEDFQIGNYYIDYGDSIIIKNDKNVHSYSTGGYQHFRILIAGLDKSTNTIATKCFFKTIFVSSDEVSTALKYEFYEKLEYANFSSEKLSEIKEPFFALEIVNSNERLLNDSSKLTPFVKRVNEIYNEKTNQYSYIVGKTSNPFELIAIFREAHKFGFENAEVKAFAKDSVRIEDLGFAYDESGGVDIVINNIQFEYNGHKLDKNSKVLLQKLIDYLNHNNKVSIEIGAHTDASRNVEKAKKLFASRGQTYTKEAHDKMSRNYNLQLSKKRAKSVVDFLIEKGISASRLKHKGYGESIPIATNDTPEGRAKNRRVTFKIL